MMDEHDALKKAIEAAGWSGCQKSQRGVAIWRRSGGLISQDTNRPAAGRCDGSDACRRSCGKLCIHAEANAILSAQQWGKPMRGGEMIHVKVVDGQAVPSGPPSCWQCSRTILRSGLEAMWLLHANEGGDPVLVRYTATEFHDLTLRYCRIHPYDVQPGDFVIPKEDEWDRFKDILADQCADPLPLAMLSEDPPVLEIVETDMRSIERRAMAHYKLEGLPFNQT